MNLPHHGTDIATYRTEPYVQQRGPGEKLEEERMGSSGVPPSGPLRARLQELKKANPHSGRKDGTTEDELTDLRNGEQAFMAITPKLIPASRKLAR